ncbi:MAG TPA: nuclear transport factor 2 family protein [Povalibacter sp.]
MRLLTRLLVLSMCFAHVAAAETPAQLTQQVRDAETAFAATMAQRDLDAFASYLAEDAVFFGREEALRGKAAVVAGWKPLYQGEKPPFSWRPESVEVLSTGTLAHSTGPVFDPNGKQVGSFNSVWRREADGRWRVVFDKGCHVCACADTKGN